MVDVELVLVHAPWASISLASAAYADNGRNGSVYHLK